jgi:hypothetical protein
MLVCCPCDLDKELKYRRCRLVPAVGTYQQQVPGVLQCALQPNIAVEQGGKSALQGGNVSDAHIMAMGGML